MTRLKAGLAPCRFLAKIDAQKERVTFRASSIPGGCFRHYVRLYPSRFIHSSKGLDTGGENKYFKSVLSKTPALGFTTRPTPNWRQSPWVSDRLIEKSSRLKPFSPSKSPSKKKQKIAAHSTMPLLCCSVPVSAKALSIVYGFEPSESGYSPDMARPHPED